MKVTTIKTKDHHYQTYLVEKLVTTFSQRVLLCCLTKLLFL
jgi:hypothetical protein